jgi:hypothetical protein
MTPIIDACRTVGQSQKDLRWPARHGRSGFPPAPGADSASVPAWMSRTTALYRSTDLVAPDRLLTGQPVGQDLISVGDTLVMVGTAGDRCSGPDGRCTAAAWRSADDGTTWQSVAVAWTQPAGVTHSMMTAAASLPDGTLVAVGIDITDSGSSGAAWVSLPRAAD